MAWTFWKKAMMHRWMLNAASGNTKSWVVNTFGKEWTKHRTDLKFPEKSFNQLWKEKNKQEKP
jgi:L-lactate dehydrogenase complex protein LldF